MLRNMRYPYQCLAFANNGEDGRRSVLCAARRDQILVVDTKSGALLSSWPTHMKEDPTDKPSSPEIITSSANGELTRKCRRTSKPNKAHEKNFRFPIITKLEISSDGCYIVVVTGEDKNIHVLEIDGGGILKHLSQRRMLKRPCAIRIVYPTDGDSYILCGDKFGDVYALPLLPKKEESLNAKNLQDDGHQPILKPFKPAATPLTVHTAKNLRALESQLKNGNQRPKPKERMDFEYDLLLGHVSMLTDLVAVTVREDSLPDSDEALCSGQRSYILTADRDEHIRVSRGRPQTHITEHFCFGHLQFVNKLCLASLQILVSGGGDDFLFIWDWLKGELLGKIDLRGAVENYNHTQQSHNRIIKSGMAQSVVKEPDALQDTGDATENHANMGDVIQESITPILEDEEEEFIAVSGLWSISSNNDKKDIPIDVLCACEGIPALFRFKCEDIAVLEHNEKQAFHLDIFPLQGNPLDVAIVDRFVLVSVDNIHKPGKPIALRHQASRDDHEMERIQVFSLNAKETAFVDRSTVPNWSSGLVRSLNEMEEPGADHEMQELENMAEFFYGSRHLRKCGVEDIDDDLSQCAS